MDKNIAKKLKIFFKDKTDAWAVLVFGSQTKKTTTPFSDVDVALLYNPDKLPPVESKLDLKENLVSLLKKEVDVVLLNEANPILKHQIYKSAALIINRNPSFYHRFFVRSLNEYDDIKKSRLTIEQSLLRRRVYG